MGVVGWGWWWPGVARRGVGWGRVGWDGVAWLGEERRGEARRGKARQGEARRGKARRGEARRSEAKQARQGKARQGKARQGEARVREGERGEGDECVVRVRVGVEVVRWKKNYMHHTVCRSSSVEISVYTNSLRCAVGMLMNTAVPGSACTSVKIGSTEKLHAPLPVTLRT